MIDYLKNLGQQLVSEQATVLQEVRQLSNNIEHIKEIVARQQGCARVSGVLEMQSIPAVVEDALVIHAEALERDQVQVVRQTDPVPEILTDKHSVLQILVNLIINAKHALAGNPAHDRRLTISVGMVAENVIGISVTDNGVGIASANLNSILSHGFTTRKDGHGFGLHSGAIAARKLGGSLRAHSDGPGKGATFTLELPVQNGKPLDRKRERLSQLAEAGHAKS